MRGSGGVRVGLVGLGRFGKLHASVLSRLPDVEMVAICDPLADELAAVGDQFGVAGRHTDFDEMLATERLDCLFLVTPEQTHAEMAAKAIARGLPLFVEKPLATTAVEGERLAAAAKIASVHVQLGFVLRFDVHHALLKAEIAAGRLGDLVTIRVKRNCSKAWFDVYGDRAHSVFETVIHDIDLILWFSQSRCRSVYAVERHITGHAFPDACVAILQLENGTVALVETSWFVPERAPANVLTETWHGTIDAELAIVGTKQSAQLRMLDSPLRIWTDDIVKHFEGGLWPVVYGHVAGALREEDAHFIECVRTGAASTVASLDDAVEGLRIAEAIIASGKTRQEVRLR